jgi:hypothetical protein
MLRSKIAKKGVQLTTRNLTVAAVAVLLSGCPNPAEVAGEDHDVNPLGEQATCAETIATVGKRCDYSRDAQQAMLEWCQSEVGPGNVLALCHGGGQQFLRCRMQAEQCGGDGCTDDYGEFGHCIERCWDCLNEACEDSAEELPPEENPIGYCLSLTGNVEDCPPGSDGNDTAGTPGSGEGDETSPWQCKEEALRGQCATACEMD